MGLINYFFGKPKPILSDENSQKLREKFQDSYMKEAEKLIEEQGKLKAQQDLGIKQKRESAF